MRLQRHNRIVESAKVALARSLVTPLQMLSALTWCIFVCQVGSASYGALYVERRHGAITRSLKAFT